MHTSDAAGQRWRSKAGAWFGIGASPGTLLLGAGIAARHDGPAPLLAVLLGVGLIAAMLWFQGLVGLRPPAGEGGTLTEAAPRYFGPGARRLLGVVLGLAMVGWFGFNVGLGGAAAGALFGWPQWVGPLLLGLPVVALSLKGMAGWNRLAVVTTTAALCLVALVVAKLAAREAPVTLTLAAPSLLLADVAAFVGYVAVFSLRAPDFTAGLVSRRDLAICVALLCGPVAALALAGVGLQRGTGSTDLVATLASGGLAVGNLLVALAVIAPAFTCLYSGGLALRSATGWHERTAILLVALAGLALAAARFDRWLGPWLSLLAAVLPPFLVPMAAEAARRRRGQAGARVPGQPEAGALVPVWVWLPASGTALLLTFQGKSYASLTGLALAGLLTLLWQAAALPVPVNRSPSPERPSPGVNRPG